MRESEECVYCTSDISDLDWISAIADGSPTTLNWTVAISKHLPPSEPPKTMSINLCFHILAQFKEQCFFPFAAANW